MVSDQRPALWKGVFIAAFAGLLITVVALMAWLLFALLASGSPLPRIVVLRAWLLALMVIALVAYFRWPWIAAIVGWLDMALILSKTFAWEGLGLSSFIYQFSFDILFFAAAQIGLVSFLRWRRLSRLHPQQIV